eukprot:g1251.t1
MQVYQDVTPKLDYELTKNGFLEYILKEDDVIVFGGGGQKPAGHVLDQRERKSEAEPVECGENLLFSGEANSQKRRREDDDDDDNDAQISSSNTLTPPIELPRSATWPLEHADAGAASKQEERKPPKRARKDDSGQKLRNLLESRLECPICMDFLAYAVNLPCGHSTCSKCWIDCSDTGKRQECPVCRRSVARGAVSINLICDQMVEEFLTVDKSREDDYARWIQRKEEQKEYRKQLEPKRVEVVDLS